MAISAPNAPTTLPLLPRVPRTTRQVPPNPRFDCSRLYIPRWMKFRAVAAALRSSKAPRAPRLFRLLCRPNLVRPSIVADIAAMRLRRSPQTRGLSMRPARTFLSLRPRTASIPHRILFVPRHPMRMRASGTSAHVANFGPLRLTAETVGPRLDDPQISPWIGEIVGSADGQRNGNFFCAVRDAFCCLPE